jgi:Zn-dependent metalloprotease
MKESRLFIFCLIVLLFLFIGSPLDSRACRAPDEDDTPLAARTLLSDDSSDDTPDQQLHSAEINMDDKAVDARPDGRGGDAMVEDLMRASNCEARESRVFKDDLGHKHFRKAQHYRGLRVIGGEVIVHRDGNDKVYRITGKYASDLTTDTTPVLTERDALQIGLDELAGRKGLTVSEGPSLVIYRKKLAFRYVLSHSGKTPGRWQYHVNAHDGTVINRFNAITYLAPTQNGRYRSLSGYRLDGEGGNLVKVTGFKDARGKYFMYNRNSRWGIFNQRTKDWAQQTKPDWDTGDRAAVSCAKNFNIVQRWVKSALLRNSFDDLGGFARANVHVGKNYVNAYWDGAHFSFGDGNGIDAGPLTSLDIVAHEYGHAITQYTSNLEYNGESGALNESYSDIMGCAVEWASQPADYKGSPGYSDWTMGEDAWLSAPALRDMRNPKLYGQPSYYKGTNWYFGRQDNGGVHTNSGVQNFAFYLLAQGGTGSNDGHPYSIKGLGKRAAAQIAMRANMVYLTSTSGYADSRRAWINAAKDLGYPAKTVAAVWTAVGVN